jgi:phosphoribosylformylglycinamidine synthase
VTDDGLLRVKSKGETVAQIPNAALVDDAPAYNRPASRPRYLDEVRRLQPSELRERVEPTQAFLSLLRSPTVASKRWVYRQYDHMVRTNTIVLAGMGAGVVRVKGTSRALAMSLDGNGRYCYLDPRRGAALALAEAARNVACAGAVPIGATNCLNFGNPERPEIMWQLAEAVEGLADACRALDIPITGGNVSLYNETDGRPIYPTPVIGVVGVIDDASRVVARAFRQAGDDIVLLGEDFGELGGSEYLKVVHGLVKGEPPRLDLDREQRLQKLLATAAARGLLQSAHDCSDGGLAVALAECTFETGGIGAGVDVPVPSMAGSSGDDTLREPAPGAPSPLGKGDKALFSETASRAIVSVRPKDRAALLELASEAGVPAFHAGVTGGDRLRIQVDGLAAIDCVIAEVEEAWSKSLESYFKRVAA